MDVLAMTQPYTICLLPSPDQLRPAAQKLLSEGAFQNRYPIVRKDLSRLLSLLLRLRLREAKWGSRFHFGTIEERDLGGKELADILVRGLAGNQDENYLTSDEIRTAMYLLVSLDLVARAGSKSHVGYCSVRRVDDLAMSFCRSDHPTAFRHLMIAGSTRHDFSHPLLVMAISLFGTSNSFTAKFATRVPPALGHSFPTTNGRS